MSEQTDSEKYEKATKAWESHIRIIIKNLTENKKAMKREIKAIDEYIAALESQLQITEAK